MKIEILSFEGCPHHVLAMQRVHAVLRELGVEAEVREIDVPDEATAQRVGFPGSPTIRVNGEDVVSEPNDTAYSMRCRVYSVGGVLAGAPDTTAIRNAIERNLR